MPQEIVPEFAGGSMRRDGAGRLSQMVFFMRIQGYRPRRLEDQMSGANRELVGRSADTGHDMDVRSDRQLEEARVCGLRPTLAMS